MSKFTGLHWICEKNGNGDFFIDSSRGESIGILYNDVPEVEANARLIAVAPEMYNLLKAIANIDILKNYVETTERNGKVKTGKSVIQYINEFLEWVDDNDNE
ncbi:MAG: hypothetical protein IJP41_09170 [Synergistaceae bacterium]|nr:hypothetical protein [Synergistaceae bacterium]